jgi:hypothetical protein
MTLKINPWLATLVMAGILFLAFALFRGCKQSRIEVAAKEKAEHIADSAIAVLKNYKKSSDSTSQDFQDTLEFERGQKELAKAQKERTEADLLYELGLNKELIAKHHLADYTDTATIVVPNQYAIECEDCFTKLDNTTKISLKYKDDFNNLGKKWDAQSQLYEKRFKQLNEEKLGFYNRINSLAKEAKEATDKLKPHGRLYLSWGVMFGPWPKMAGGGLMYQTKYNLMYEANWFYGNQGHMVEASIKFPLSIKL